MWRDSAWCARASALSRLKDHSKTLIRLISPTQRPLPDDTQKSYETDMVIPAGFESKIPASEPPQAHALDRTNTGSAVFNWATLNIIDTVGVLMSDSSSEIRQYRGENRGMRHV